MNNEGPGRDVRAYDFVVVPLGIPVVTVVKRELPPGEIDGLGEQGAPQLRDGRGDRHPLTEALDK